MFRFQSTHPLRGATLTIQNGVLSADISIHAPLAGCDTYFLCRTDIHSLISIHAPLAGCDWRWRCGACCITAFQSTHPLRGATSCWPWCLETMSISIHAPLAGCDAPAAQLHGLIGISIHAPLAGCDSIGLCALFAIYQFQSTHPLRGATQRVAGLHQHACISIHAPLAGCDSKNVQRKLHFFELADKLSARIAAKKPSAKADRCA